MTEKEFKSFIQSSESRVKKSEEKIKGFNKQLGKL